MGTNKKNEGLEYFVFSSSGGNNCVRKADEKGRLCLSLKKVSSSKGFKLPQDVFLCRFPLEKNDGSRDWLYLVVPYELYESSSQFFPEFYKPSKIVSSYKLSLGTEHKNDYFIVAGTPNGSLCTFIPFDVYKESKAPDPLQCLRNLTCELIGEARFNELFEKIQGK